MLPALLALLAACSRHAADDGAIVVVAGDPSAAVDECELACFTLAGPPDTELSLKLDVFGELRAHATTDADGLVEVCPAPASIPPAATTLTVSSEDDTLVIPLDVRTFGWALGLDRPRATAPEVTRLPRLAPAEEPFFEPAPGTWYSFQVAHGFLLGELLVFGGTDHYEADEEHNPYELGVARVVDGAVTEVQGPLFADGGWGAGARNGPELSFDGERYTLWFHAHEDELPGIGRAFSPDGVDWELDPANPVFPNTENGGASHPTVLERGDGVLELWHGGEGGLGHALSVDDGASFTPYCANPVFPRDTDGGLKAPNVAWDGERYLLAVTQGDFGDYEVTWGESLDGIRWTKADRPALSPGDADWNDTEVGAGEILLDGDTIRLLHSGNGSGDPGNGFGIAEPVTSGR